MPFITPEGELIRRPERQKTHYFSGVAIKNLKTARILWAGEVLGKNRQGLDVWRNVSEHCLVQTAACGELAQELGLSQESRRNLELAAMGHDWDKKYQSQGLRKINGQIASGDLSEEAGGKVKYDFFEESEEHSVNGMRERRIPEEIIRIASADGHPALPRVMRPDCSIEEKILHYIGSITDESRIVPLDERVDNLERNERYKMMNEYGRQVAWTDGRTLYEVQRAVGHQIEQELVQMLIDSGNLPSQWEARLQEKPEDLPLFIVEKIQDHYSH